MHLLGCNELDLSLASLCVHLWLVLSHPEWFFTASITTKFHTSSLHDFGIRCKNHALISSSDVLMMRFLQKMVLSTFKRMGKTNNRFHLFVVVPILRQFPLSSNQYHSHLPQNSPANVCFSNRFSNRLTSSSFTYTLYHYHNWIVLKLQLDALVRIPVVIECILKLIHEVQELASH